MRRLALVAAMLFALALSGSPACASPAGEPEQEEACADCPVEVRAILEGKTRVTRRSASLENDCLALEPIHPMLQAEHRHRLSKPLDRAEVENALAYGPRRVRALPRCEGRIPSLPAEVVLARPLAAEDRQRDDGTPKPTIYVDRANPACRHDGAARVFADPATPACSVAAAVRATRRGGGAIVEIAGGVYPEFSPIRLGHGHVLVARDDEPVTLSGWVDLSRGRGHGRPWRLVSKGALGVVFALDWSDHGDASDASGLHLPLELDGIGLPMARHFLPGTVAPDVAEVAFSEWDAASAGPVFFWANPDHSNACMDSGLNVKSRELRCRRDGRSVPCAQCLADGLAVRVAEVRDGACRTHPGTCRPEVNWRVVKRAGLAACRAVLGPDVEKCLLLKLPHGDAPANHAIRSTPTNHGFRLENDPKRQASGVVIRGLALDAFPLRMVGAHQVTAASGWNARLDGLELDDSRVVLRGARLVLENSHGRRGRIFVNGNQRPLADVVLRNNLFEGYHGKPVSWSDGRGEAPGPVRRRPASLHGLAPLCEPPGCAAPGAPLLFSGHEDIFGWSGWNKVLFNVFRESAAINASGPMSHTVIAANAFSNGGIQEGILELPFGGHHVWVHHNWVRDGLGAGIRIVSGVVDLVVSDNQFLRAPGDPDEGAGPEDAAAICAALHRPCEGSLRSIVLKPGREVCRNVTIENNLSANSHHGGFAFQGCDQLTLRNNTAAFSGRLPEWSFIGSPFLRGPARVHGNVVVGEDASAEPVASYLQQGRPFRLGSTAGNYFGGCGPEGEGCDGAAARSLFATDPRWANAPRFASPKTDDFHLVDGWSGGDGCEGGGRYRHPGFQYVDEACGTR